ncbi:hypothetical protein WA158_003176 [Blastocystis sp. Blastoise]
MNKFLALLFIALVVSAADRCEVENPIDCGYDSITEDLCAARGCCWRSGNSPSCFYPEAGRVNITKVHIVHGCHFDAGYVDTLTKIVNKYFDEIFPTVHSEGMKRKQAGGIAQMKFTTQAYLISLFYDCPQNAGFHCPNEDAIKEMNESIANGFITWHAFPHVPEFEVMDPSSIEFGIRMSNDLKTHFHQEPSIIFSTNDVPGQTAGIIPIMLKNNITVFRAGVNVVSMPPNTPHIYYWKDPASKKQVLAVAHRNGYGGQQFKDVVLVPGYNEALMVCYNDDNQGPFPSYYIDSIFNSAKSWFPNAEIHASSYEDFFTPLLSKLNNPSTSPSIPIPVLEREIGDSWIHGVPSDPIKLARIRAQNRARTLCEQAGDCIPTESKYYNYSRLFIKNGEHTWGGDVKKFLHDTENWNNTEFHAMLKSMPSNYKDMIDTWDEQRYLGLDMPLEGLGDHPIKQYIQKEEELIYPNLPDLSTYKALDITADITTPSLTLHIDATTGAVTRLFDSIHNREWCNDNHPLFLAEYKAYNKEDYDAFLKEYFIVWNQWGPQDFGKPNIEQHWTGRVDTIFNKAYILVENEITHIVIENKFAQEYVRDTGASEYVYTILNIEGITIEAKMIFKNKTPTRIPESMHIVFNPIIDSEDKTGSGYEMDKLGQYYKPADLPELGLGNMHHHNILKDIKYEYNGHCMKIESPDASLVNWGTPTGFPTPFQKADLVNEGASFMVNNNIWGVNYIMWYPFREEDKDQQYRFTITLN